MINISTAQLRKEISETINRVFYANERVVIQRREKNIAVIVPYEEYRAFCRYEDLLDLEAIRKSKEVPGEYTDIESLREELRIDEKTASGDR